jgi:ribokinase
MKIYNYGSLNIDKVYRVKSFVNKGETISAYSYNEFPGGKGLNQTIAITRAGGMAVHVGVLGWDAEIIQSIMQREQITVQYIKKADSVTGHAIIQVTDSGDNAIMVCPGANNLLECGYIDETLAQTENGDIVLLQNEISNAGYVIERAHRRGLTVAFNPSPITEGLLKYPLELVDIFILNEIEGAAISGRHEVYSILTGLREKFPGASIVLTLGEKGSLYWAKGELYKAGIYNVNSVDSTAAGDTFTGYFLTCLSHGMLSEEIINYASAASAIAVSRSGAATSIPYNEEVVRFIKTNRQMSSRY